MSRHGDSVHPHTKTVRDGGYMKTITEPGITKRELFAAMAMQGLLSNAGGPYQASKQSGWRIVNCTQKQVAQECVDMADALLAELAKDGEP